MEGFWHFYRFTFFPMIAFSFEDLVSLSSSGRASRLAGQFWFQRKAISCTEQVVWECSSICKGKVPLYNTVFHGYQNLPCSPNPNMGRIVKANSEEKYFFDGGKHMPSRILPDDESLFMLCEGLVIHYKITNSHSYTSSAFHDSNGDNYGSMLRKLRFDDPLLPRSHNLATKFSHTSTNEPLYTPLLSGSTTIEVNPSSKCGSNSYSGFFEHIPLLNLEKYKHDKFGLIEKLSQPTPYKFGRMGVILIHGFGGGVFSWRYVMNPLERQTGCTVAAFDQPGWELTSCPSKSEWKVKGLPNSCELEFQVSLLSSFCQKLAFSSVVLIGHYDGGLLALMAAERLYKRQDISNAVPEIPHISEGYNPTTWASEVSSIAVEEKLGVEFVELYRKLALYEWNQALIQELSNPAPGSQDLSFPTQYARSFKVQCVACLWKQHWSYWRKPHYNVV